MLVHQLIEAGQDSDIALRYKKNKVTYEQLKTMINRFRDYFYSVGVRSGENVGLFSKNSPEFLYSYFAIISLGAVVVPINYVLTPREISYIVQDSKMKNIVVMNPIELNIEVNQLILTEIMADPGRSVIASAPFVDLQDDWECVIIYTSGTTGFPKGAILSHNNLTSNAKAMTEAVLATKEDNLLCVLPMFHSFSWTVTVLAPLFVGGSITIVESFLPKEVINTIFEEEVTLVCGVPAMYNFYLSLGDPEVFAKVRVFVSGGASLPVEIINRFQIKIGKPIIEGYGLSEASPVVCINPLEKTKPGSIGVPLAQVEVKVMDAEGNVLPAGEIGELIVKGPNVMKGYFNMPEATTQAIIDGWLHTGDMAYEDEEGYFYIVDRLKDLIIVAGLNVYPREVEEVIYQYPGISETAVIGIPNEVRGEAVCAFVVLKEGIAFNKKEFMSFLQKNLANYKLPREVFQVESLPRNATGKISKRELLEGYNTV